MEILDSADLFQMSVETVSEETNNSEDKATLNNLF